MRPTTGRHLSPRQGQVKDGCKAVLAIPAPTSLVWAGGNRYLAKTVPNLPQSTLAQRVFRWCVSTVVIIVLDLYVWLLIASAILSWLIAFNVVNTRNQFVAAVAEFLYRITEPVLAPIRRRLPALGRARYLADRAFFCFG